MKLKGGFFLFLAIVVGLFVYNQFQKTATEDLKEGIISFSAAKGFWKGKGQASEYGYLLTANKIPLRAISRRPNVPLFDNPETGPENSFREVMLPWKPYYVYAYDAKKGALRVAEKAQLKAEDALWVLETDVYCWTTRETLNLEKPVSVYATLEDAKAGKNPIAPGYTYVSTTTAPNADKRLLPSMTALPVLTREEGQFWSFIRPDPEPNDKSDVPYQVCWIRWDGQDPSTTVRLRITRVEFEEYTSGLQKLLYEYRYGSPDEQAKIRTDMKRDGQAVTTGEEDRAQVRKIGETDLQVRTKGIPHPLGITVKPPQNDLEYKQTSERFQKVLQLGNDSSIWMNEIAYIDVSRLP